MYSRTAIVRCFFAAPLVGDSKSIPKDVGDECQTNFRHAVVPSGADSAIARVDSRLVRGSCT